MRIQNVIVRHAVRDDIPGLIILLSALFSIEADFTPNPEKQKHGLLAMLEGCGEHRCIKVAEVNGEIVGMGSIQIVLSTAEGGPVGIVEDIIVKKNQRRLGIGKRLLEEIEAWSDCHGLLRLQLLADRNNLPALAFYEKSGWSRTNLICLRRKNIS